MVGLDSTARKDAMATTPLAPERLTKTADRPSPVVGSLRGLLEDPERRVSIVGAIGCLGLLGLIFWPNLRQFVHVWSTDGNYSHGFLVPLISVYFATQAARRGPLVVRAGVGLGSTLLVLSILGRLATVLIPVGFVGDLAFLIGLAGVCALIFGADVLRRYWFAFVFLIFMVPLPVSLYAQIASPLQLMVSQIASAVMNAMGLPVLREGNMMTLPGNLQMFVAEACSGMRQMTGFLALTAAVAYLSSRPTWYRFAVIAMAIPIAMTANITRVILTGYIMYYVNPQFASGNYHTAEGLIMMGFGLALLRAGCLVLDACREMVGPIQPSQDERL
jgi:exosortase